MRVRISTSNKCYIKISFLFASLIYNLYVSKDFYYATTQTLQLTNLVKHGILGDGRKALLGVLLAMLLGAQRHIVLQTLQRLSALGLGLAKMNNRLGTAGRELEHANELPLKRHTDTAD